jgi:hypothetical protein
MAISTAADRTISFGLHGADISYLTCGWRSTNANCYILHELSWGGWFWRRPEYFTKCLTDYQIISPEENRRTRENHDRRGPSLRPRHFLCVSFLQPLDIFYLFYFATITVPSMDGENERFQRGSWVLSKVLLANNWIGRYGVEICSGPYWGHRVRKRGRERERERKREVVLHIRR